MSSDARIDHGNVNRPGRKAASHRSEEKSGLPYLVRGEVVDEVDYPTGGQRSREHRLHLGGVRGPDIRRKGDETPTRGTGPTRHGAVAAPTTS